MFNKKEIFLILGITLVLALALSFLKGLEFFLNMLLLVFIVLAINVLAKKITSFYLDSEIEIKLWDIKRMGLMHFLSLNPFSSRHPSKEFKRPFPAGVFLPLLFSFFTLGNFVWLASLVFETKPKVYRAAKRHGLYNFSSMTEDHIGFIAAAGIFANLLIAVIAYLIGFSEFARLSIYYSLFNILPISDLDGNKIFFGNLVLWSFLATIVLIGVGFVIFVV